MATVGAGAIAPAADVASIVSTVAPTYYHASCRPEVQEDDTEIYASCRPVVQEDDTQLYTSCRPEVKEGDTQILYNACAPASYASLYFVECRGDKISISVYSTIWDCTHCCLLFQVSCPGDYCCHLVTARVLLQSHESMY